MFTYLLLTSKYNKMLEDGIGIQVLVTTVAFFAGVYLLLQKIKQNRVKDAGKQHPPSLPVLPLVGSVLRGGMTVLPEYFMKAEEKLGPVFSFTMGRGLVVVLNGYEAIFSALVRQSETFADRGSMWIEEKLLNHELRGISFARYNDVFKKNQKLSLSILREFGFGVDRVAEVRILQEVESLNEEILKQNGLPFNPDWPLTYATSNVVLRILFGNNFMQSLPKEHSAIVESARECFSNMDLTLNMAPFVRFLPKYKRTVERLQSSCERLLKAIETGIEFIKSTKSETTFVGRFLEIEGANYDHQDLLYVLRDLCFGSTDTVATTLRWALLELANNPKIQTRFQEEIDDVVPLGRLPSLDDKPRLPYTEAVILEVMRRHTIAPFLAPHAALKDTKVLEYDVPEGCMVIPNAYSVHMDPKFWKDPENFRPERFLDDDNKIINSKKVIAFGLGKRSCLGEILGRQKTFLFLTSLVQSFDIRPPEGQDSIRVKEITALVMIPSSFKVRLIPRMKQTDRDQKEGLTLKH